jgi:glutamate-ammonia-ligase adenylyltransferase
MAGMDFPQGFFSDARRASRQISTLHQAFITSGSRFSLAQFSEILERLLRMSPDPDLSLTTFTRFAEASVSRATLFNDLLTYPVVAEVFGKLAGSSPYLADILVRDPGLFHWLMTSEALTLPVRPEELRLEAQRLGETFPRPERRLEAMKRLYRREFLRIGARDMLGIDDLASTTQQLSCLADVIVDEVLRLSVVQMDAKAAGGPLFPYVVIGLGKLGGGELNYSSDIDLLCVYDDTVGSDSERALGHYHRLTEQLVRNLSAATAEGHLYRVDMRLRPESGAGPLARSQTSTLLYYESRGELWERQMLIKARPVAGDLEFGAAFLKSLEPFIFPRTFIQHPADSVARIKSRIEVSVGAEQNIKLMPGGIRDIEFTVQTLQLINGGTRPSVREGNTLRALERLRNEGLLQDDEARVLGEGYGFLRRLEHRLQIVMNTQTHTLPADERQLLSLARGMGFDSGTDLRDQIARCMQGVRSVYNRVLTVPVEEKHGGILGLLEGGADEPSVQQTLKSSGFRDTRKALRHLHQLTRGSSLTGVQELDARTREAFRSAAPVLFEEIASTPDPDMTLTGLTAILSSSRHPGQYYALLASPGFRKLVLGICRVSPRFARGLATDQLFFETLTADPEHLRAEADLTEVRNANLLSFKNRHELRAGIRHLLGFTSFPRLTADLSGLADAIVRKVLAEEIRRLRAGRETLAVLALGKYGTRELGYDADLDLLFVAPERRASSGRVENLASALLRRLTSVEEAGRLYEVDARLRPEGRNAPLVVTLGAYVTYLQTRASLWERQSLTRLRFVAGSEKVGKDVLRRVRKFIVETPLQAGWTQDIVGMRKRMESRSRFRGAAPVDIKLGPGGMVDIEFLAQMVQLRMGKQAAALFGRPTEEVLAGAPRHLVTEDESVFLARAYAFFRNIELHLRIALEEHGSLLPGGPTLWTLARCMGQTDEQHFVAEVEERMKRVRVFFLTIARRME